MKAVYRVTTRKRKEWADSELIVHKITLTLAHVPEESSMPVGGQSEIRIVTALEEVAARFAPGAEFEVSFTSKGET